MATLEEFTKKEKQKADQQLADISTKQRQNVDNSIQQYGQNIDNQVAATNQEYQKQIDDAPSRYRSLYDQNTISQLVAKKNLQESMANAGLTNSGLNRSEMTAIELQKGNADNAVSQQKQQFIDSLKSAMSKVIAEGEAKKSDYANQMNTNYTDWYNQAAMSLDQAARDNATQLYNQQEQNATDTKNAYIKAGYTYNSKTKKWEAPSASATLDSTIRTLAADLLKKGTATTADEALQMAQGIYGVGSQNNTKNQSKVVQDVDNVMKDFDAQSVANFWTFWGKGDEDGRDQQVVANNVRKQLQTKVQGKSTDVKNAAYAKAVGLLVASTWRDTGVTEQNANKLRIKGALKTLGVPEEYYAYATDAYESKLFGQNNSFG